MPWVVVDVVLVVVGLVCLLLTGLTLWRAVKGLTKDLATAGSSVGEVTDRLARLQAEGAGGAATARHAPERQGRPARVR